MFYSPIPLVMMGVYILCVIFLSYQASFSKRIRAKMKNQNFEEYYTAGKSMNAVVVALITIVTFYSGTTFTGRVGFFFNFGVVAFSTVFACSMVGVIMFFLSEKIWPLSKKYRLSTLSDMLELRYQSKALKMLTAVTIVCFNIVWLISEIKTLGFAMNVASGGGIPIRVGSAIAFTIIILYVMTGGVRSVAAVDSFSAVVMLGGSLMVLCYVIGHFFDGNVFTMLAEGAAAKPEIMTVNKGVLHNMPYWISNVFLSTIVMLVYPSNYMSICLAKSVRSVKKSAIVTSLSGPWLCIFGLFALAALGVSSRGFVFSDPEASLLEMLSFSESGLMLGLVTTFILAASLGTLDSTLISLSGLLSNDIISNAGRIRDKEPCIGELGDQAAVISDRVNKNAKGDIFRTRVIVVVLGCIAFVLHLVQLPMMVVLVNYAANGLCQIVPCVIGGLYWRKATPQGAISSLVTGVGSFLIMDIVVKNMEINMGGLMLGLPALAVATTVFIVVSLCTHKKYYEKNARFSGIYSDFFEKGKVNAYIKENF